MDRLQTNDHFSPLAVIRTATRSPLQFFGEGGTTPRRSQRQNKIPREENREGPEACSCKSAHANSAACRGTKLRRKIIECLMSLTKDGRKLVPGVGVEPT